MEKVYWLLLPQYHAFDSKFERQKPIEHEPYRAHQHLDHLQEALLDPNPFPQNLVHKFSTKIPLARVTGISIFLLSQPSQHD